MVMDFSLQIKNVPLYVFSFNFYITPLLRSQRGYVFTPELSFIFWLVSKDHSLTNNNCFCYKEPFHLTTLKTFISQKIECFICLCFEGKIMVMDFSLHIKNVPLYVCSFNFYITPLLRSQRGYVFTPELSFIFWLVSKDHSLTNNNCFCYKEPFHLTTLLKTFISPNFLLSAVFRQLFHRDFNRVQIFQFHQYVSLYRQIMIKIVVAKKSG